MLKIWLFPILFGLYVSERACAAQSELNASQQSGRISFSGQHAGMDFSGKFERWQAKLILPPATAPSITATFQMNSAKTGDSIYDSTLPEFDWFDVENHALGQFVSSKVSATKNGYQVVGDLTLKGITQPVSFELKDNGSKLKASFDVNRLAFGIGLESDPEAEWVSKTISMAVEINQ